MLKRAAPGEISWICSRNTAGRFSVFRHFRFAGAHPSALWALKSARVLAACCAVAALTWLIGAEPAAAEGLSRVAPTYACGGCSDDKDRSTPTGCEWQGCHEEEETTPVQTV